MSDLYLGYTVVNIPLFERILSREFGENLEDNYGRIIMEITKNVVRILYASFDRHLKISYKVLDLLRF